MRTASLYCMLLAQKPPTRMTTDCFVLCTPTKLQQILKKQDELQLADNIQSGIA